MKIKKVSFEHQKGVTLATLLQSCLTGTQRIRLLEIGDMRPVHRTLHSEIKVRSEIKK